MATWLYTETFKDRLGILGNASDVAINGILAGVQSAIENIISSPVVQDTTARTEYYDGVVGRELKLRFRPVVKDDLQVWVDDGGNYGDGPYTPFAAATELVLGTDFDLLDVYNGYSQSGNLIMLNGIWPSTWQRPPNRLASELVGERGSVKVTYKAGWERDDIPQNIVQSGYAEATMLYRMMYGKGARGTLLMSESWNGYSYSNGMITGFDVSGYGPARLANPVAMAMLGGLGVIDPVIA